MATTRTTITKTTGIKRKAAAPKKGGISPLALALAGGAVGVGLYFLLKPELEKLFKGETTVALTPRLPAEQIAPIAPAAPPVGGFTNIASVATRLIQVTELYRMGYMAPPAAMAETDQMITATQAFMAANPTTIQEGTDLLARIADFRDDIQEYLALQSSTAVT